MTAKDPTLRALVRGIRASIPHLDWPDGKPPEMPPMPVREWTELDCTVGDLMRSRPTPLG